MRHTPRGVHLSEQLAELVRRLDPPSGWGRAVTAAVPFVTPDDDAFFAPLDVAGYNYSPDRYELDHRRVPGRVIVGTEVRGHASKYCSDPL